MLGRLQMTVDQSLQHFMKLYESFHDHPARLWLRGNQDELIRKWMNDLVDLFVPEQAGKSWKRKLFVSEKDCCRTILATTWKDLTGYPGDYLSSRDVENARIPSSGTSSLKIADAALAVCSSATVDGITYKNKTDKMNSDLDWAGWRRRNLSDISLDTNADPSREVFEMSIEVGKESKGVSHGMGEFAQRILPKRFISETVVEDDGSLLFRFKLETNLPWLPYKPAKTLKFVGGQTRDYFSKVEVMQNLEKCAVWLLEHRRLQL